MSLQRKKLNERIGQSTVVGISVEQYLVGFSTYFLYRPGVELYFNKNIMKLCSTRFTIRTIIVCSLYC